VINCAGGLMVEHPLVLPYRKKIIGTEESVMGLSLELLASLLEKLKKL
jgi:septum formation protein